MNWSFFYAQKIMLERCLVAGAFILLCMPTLASSASLVYPERLPAGVRLQILFENAKLGAQPLSSYRIVSNLSPDRLLADFEDLWRLDPSARVWRSDQVRTKILSRVARFPEVDVLQVGTDKQGRLQAILSRGVPTANGSDGDSICAMNWLPPGTRILQTFTNADSDRTSCLLLATANASLNDCRAWILAHAKRDRFREDPKLRLSPGVSGGGVVVLAKEGQEVILTLNTHGPITELVLQKSVPRP
jgi:hypothetical protein